MWLYSPFKVKIFIMKQKYKLIKKMYRNKKNYINKDKIKI